MRLGFTIRRRSVGETDFHDSSSECWWRLISTIRCRSVGETGFPRFVVGVLVETDFHDSSSECWRD